MRWISGISVAVHTESGSRDSCNGEKGWWGTRGRIIFRVSSTSMGPKGTRKQDRWTGKSDRVWTELFPASSPTSGWGREKKRGSGRGRGEHSGPGVAAGSSAWPTAFQPAAPSPHNHVRVRAQMLSHVNSLGSRGLRAFQVPLSVEFSRQEYCSGLPCPPPGDLSHPEIESTFLVSSALAGRFFTTEPPGKLAHTHSPRQSQETERRSE